jgi:hypothetical protein
MKALLLPLLFLVVLAGCAPYPDYRTELRNHDLAECDGMFTKNMGISYAQWMRQCLAITGGSNVTLIPFNAMAAPRSQGLNPNDPFGPLGYRGPTWGQYNDSFRHHQ